jgi:phosphoesterase RecJ-like protein
MTFDSAQIDKVRRELDAAQRVLVVSHTRPDGDAVGSLLGLGLALLNAGKDVQMLLSDGIPSNFQFLDGCERVKKYQEGDFDYICVVDCSDLDRAQNALKDDVRPDLNIDHHQTNLHFARINLVDTNAVSTTEIIADLLPLWDIPLTKNIASALLTGLVTDTIGFRTSNVSPKAMRLAASLMEHGVNLSDIYRRSLVNRSYEAIRLWGVGLGKLERNGRMVWTSLTLADRESVNYPGRDDADLVNILTSIEDIDVALIFSEQPHRKVKVSWRSRPGFDVSKIAMSFGGGGHPVASGAEIKGSLQNVQDEVLKKTRLMINGDGKIH